MELRHLRYLVAVTEAGSFVGAAARVRVAQPALSRQIRDLERELGVDLFERDARGAELTPAGQATVDAARRILSSAEAAFAQVRLAAQGLAGRCVIGAGRLMLWNGLLPRMIERARTEFPGIEIHVEERALASQWSGLTDCSLDIGIGTAPPPTYTRLASEMQALDVYDAIGVAPSHPLAARTSITLAELSDETFVHRDDEGLGEPFRLLRTEFVRRGFKPRRETKADSLEAMMVQLRAGTGWSMIPRSVRRHVGRELTVIPLDDLAVPACYARTWRRGDARPVVKTLLSLFRRIAEDDGTSERRRRTPASTEAIDSSGTSCPVARLELRHLRYFVAIAEEGSIGRAAERLSLTQPALSRQARDLEQLIGVPLFERAARGVTLTLAGYSLYDSARELLQDAERVAGEARRAERGRKRSCIIGIVPTPLILDVATKAIRACAVAHPEIAISIEDVPTPHQIRSLSEARIDIGIGHAYPSGTNSDIPICRTPLYSDRLDTALIASSSPLAEQSSISFADIVDLPFLFMRRVFNPAFYEFVMTSFARCGYRPRIDGEYDGLTTVWSLAAQGLGWCLGASSQRTSPPPGLTALPISGFAVPWGSELIHREGEAREAVLAVLAAATQAAADVVAEHDKPRKEVLAGGEHEE
ncbi:MAG TPA: LysR family transcriptional regulator [Gemmatimonadaceae bacterium]|jgi:LysR family transcriptional regulator, benzoate and cis,cis-muconate-responsive activator of ben and cat genes|nr:LysR family transcriptional regulator [Gemmatimonadaceae bacterium]